MNTGSMKFMTNYIGFKAHKLNETQAKEVKANKNVEQFFLLLFVFFEK
jgi:hypothetical protein